MGEFEPRRVRFLISKFRIRFEATLAALAMIALGSSFNDANYPFSAVVPGFRNAWLWGFGLAALALVVFASAPPRWVTWATAAVLTELAWAGRLVSALLDPDPGPRAVGAGLIMLLFVKAFLSWSAYLPKLPKE